MRDLYNHLHRQHGIAIHTLNLLEAEELEELHTMEHAAPRAHYAGSER